MKVQNDDSFVKNYPHQKSNITYLYLKWRFVNILIYYNWIEYKFWWLNRLYIKKIICYNQNKKLVSWRLKTKGRCSYGNRKYYASFLLWRRSGIAICECNRRIPEFTQETVECSCNWTTRWRIIWIYGKGKESECSKIIVCLFNSSIRKEFQRKHK